MLLTDAPAPFYVIGGFLTKPTPSPWVLGLYHTELEAKQAITNQDVGTGSPNDFRVCTFDPNLKRFDVMTGGSVDFPLRPAPYTREAYGKFMEAHGIDPKHMQTEI